MWALRATISHVMIEPMYIGIISDIHANLAALESVLRAMGPVERLWCLGDVVGYGPDPNECIDYLRAQPNLDVCLMGNHDAAVIGAASIADFSAEAQQAVHWTREQLSACSREFLGERRALVAHDAEFTLAHASPRDPLWEYITSTDSASENFLYFQTPVCFVGHTHVPAIFSLGHPSIVRLQAVRHGTDLSLRDALAARRYILNPGSVGQPRDSDPRAAYAVLDAETGNVQFQRVAYDIAATQRRMQAAHLPANLIYRLDYGW